MAELCDSRELRGPDEAGAPLWEEELFQGQRLPEKDPWQSWKSRSLPGCLTRAPLAVILLLISLGLFLLLLTTLIQISRIQQSLPRMTDHQESHSPVFILQKQLKSDLEEIRQQLTWMNATLAGLCRPCPWDWYLFQGSCYIFSQTKNTWKASVSACEGMQAQLVTINNTEEQKFLLSWDTRNNKNTWIGLSDQHNEGSWKWVDNSPVHLSFWSKGEPNNHDDEDCVELTGDGWNDYKCSAEFFWICEKPAAPCPGL